ncbi:hypothetical protein, partial [Rhizobium sp. LEGMi135b]
MTLQIFVVPAGLRLQGESVAWLGLFIAASATGTIMMNLHLASRHADARRRRLWGSSRSGALDGHFMDRDFAADDDARAVQLFTETLNRSISLFLAIPDGKPLRTFPGIACLMTFAAEQAKNEPLREGCRPPSAARF